MPHGVVTATENTAMWTTKPPTKNDSDVIAIIVRNTFSTLFHGNTKSEVTLLVISKRN